MNPFSCLIKALKCFISLVTLIKSFLGIPPATLLDCHSGMLKSDGNNPSTMRLLYYPPVPPEDEDPCCQGKCEKYTRCGAHADYGTFTLLTQDSEGGLEVRKFPPRDI